MTVIFAKMILDSVNENGNRLSTLHLRYPRMIHSELMTHRMFSRNARSSRAVPVKKMLEEIKQNPVMPLFWGKNQKGMQASEECNEPIEIKWLDGSEVTVNREQAWLTACEVAVRIADGYADAGYHKQVANRILEPYMHIDTLISATNFENFLHLRDHADAEPHFDLLAKCVREEREQSEPKFLRFGEWHLPFVTNEEMEKYDIDTLKKLSAARCARISYAPFNGNADIESEIARYDQLITSDPVHASPVEHQATPDRVIGLYENGIRWQNRSLHGNFTGFIQYRKTIPGEFIEEPLYPVEIN